MLFIAARGGVGEDIGLQANMIAASFAEACGGTYSTLYYPDSLSEEAQEAFRKEPSVMKMVSLYETTDCVLHGIGNAETMALMRNSTEEEHLILQKQGQKAKHSVIISIEQAKLFTGYGQLVFRRTVATNSTYYFSSRWEK